MLDPDGRQDEAFPYNDPMMLPITPARNRDGGWLRIHLELSGRPLSLTLRHFSSLIFVALFNQAIIRLCETSSPLFCVTHPILQCVQLLFCPSLL